MKAAPSLISLVLAIALTMGLAPAMAQQSVTPQITVRQEDDQTIREYRVNGRLYAIEIESGDGSSYHLLDRTGDGNFERRQGDRIEIPSWAQESQ